MCILFNSNWIWDAMQSRRNWSPPPTSLRFLKEYRQSHNHCYKLDKCWLISHLLQQNGHARRLRNKLTTVSYNKTSQVPPFSTPTRFSDFPTVLEIGPSMKTHHLFEEWQFDVTKQFTCAWTGSLLYEDCCCCWCCCDFFVLLLPAYLWIIHELLYHNWRF